MAGLHTAVRFGAIALMIVLAVMMASTGRADAVGGEGESWPAFGESDGCGSPWMRGPKVERTGSLSPSTILRGPHANYFGRSVQQVWDSLRWWDVPMSNGESLRLHERMFPALDVVEQNLAEEMSNGNFYSIEKRYTFGYTARTVGGSYRVSQHALGNAIDLNSVYNPYTTGKLKTNMPQWFVNALSDAGYCWGGYWISVKDAMHYNWRGPLFTPGMTELPPAYPPFRPAEDFTRTMHSDVVPAAPDQATHRLLMDGDNDGAIDVVNVSHNHTGMVIDVLRASMGYQGCSVSRYTTPSSEGRVAVAGDWDRDGAQDLWVIDDTDGVDITAHIRFGDFEEVQTASLTTTPGDAYLTADFNVDGWSDLYILRYRDGIWELEVFDGANRFTTIIATASFSGSDLMSFTALDKDLDQVPDLVALAGSGSLLLDGSSGYAETAPFTNVGQGYTDIAGSDFDGDGRHDLVLLDGTNLTVRAGNSKIPGYRVTSWFEFPEYQCSGAGLPYPFSGFFRDDDGSTHQADIESIAEIGITRGCNPPLNDEFCPEDTINRGELAAFIRRALALPASEVDAFADDDDSIFEGDINALAGAGIVVSCDDDGTRFCADDDVHRDVMARFLVAAFGFVDGPPDAFTDDDGTPFESDIDAIAGVGVTRGCNPPTNDLYCPDRIVTRAEMASFILRALAVETS